MKGISQYFFFSSLTQVLIKTAQIPFLISITDTAQEKR